jgi:hypothetical protein
MREAASIDASRIKKVRHMNEVPKSARRKVRARAAILILLLLCIVTAARPQSKADFSGLWMQDNDRSRPTRKGEATLRIEQNEAELIVETLISHGAANLRHAIQRYTTDGKVSTSTGADGDEFHTSIVWNGQSLVFTIEEHEDGRTILSKETWTLIENGAALQRVRERADGSEKQIQIYLREAPQS